MECTGVPGALGDTANMAASLGGCSVCSEPDHMMLPVGRTVREVGVYVRVFRVETEFQRRAKRRSEERTLERVLSMITESQRMDEWMDGLND